MSNFQSDLIKVLKNAETTYFRDRKGFHKVK